MIKAEKVPIKQKILIADDTEETLEFLETAIKLAGYEPIAVTDGSEVKQKAITEKPDLIILDLIMTNKDGLTTAIELRKDNATKDIPIIISTGKAKLKELFLLQKAVVIQDFIEKPYTPDEIIIKIKNILGE